MGRRKTRLLVLQFGVIAAIFVAIALLVLNAQANIAANGQASGFDFLWRSTGWGLSFSVLPTNINDPYWWFFVVGLLNTIVLGLISLTLATLLGVLVGALRTSGNATAEFTGTIYVEIFRNVPILLQLVFWYKVLLVLPSPRGAVSIFDLIFLTNRGTFVVWLNVNAFAVAGILALVAGGIAATCFIGFSRQRFVSPRSKLGAILGLWVLAVSAITVLLHFGHSEGTPLLSQPELKGMNFSGGFRLSPEYLACIIAISIYGSAYIGEIIRAGFDSVSSGIVEAGKSLGLSTLALFFLIRLPLAIRAILPTLTNQYVWLMKATTVGIAIGFSDLFFVTATAVNQSGQTFEIIGIFMLMFLVLNYVIARVFNRINSAIAIKGNQISSGTLSKGHLTLIPKSLRELRDSYFGSVGNTLLSLVFIGLVAWLVVRLSNWAVFAAVWDPSTPAACRAPDAGACWAVISARWRLIFFGLYPVDEQWRSALGCLALVGAAALTCFPRFWKAKLIILMWCGGFLMFILLMRGGVFGLTYVKPQNWGGLALTLFIFASVVVIGMPVAVGLALLRRSALSILSPAAGFLIDTVRSLPLIAILYSAAVILPLALPSWLQSDKLYRVIFFFALFFACYQAEVLRSGFQAMSSGQDEAGKALGLNYRHRVFRILLPQVFRLSLPTTINQLVVTFKETSLVVIVGLFEILASASAAFGTNDWSIAYLEVYIFVGLIYFAFVFSLSRYGAYLEKRIVRFDLQGRKQPANRNT